MSKFRVIPETSISPPKSAPVESGKVTVSGRPRTGKEAVSHTEARTVVAVVRRFFIRKKRAVNQLTG